jgi:hypothetical protein
MHALTELRDKGEISLSAKKIREYLNAQKCIDLLEHPGLSLTSREALKAALLNCNYVDRGGRDKDKGQPQAF